MSLCNTLLVFSFFFILCDFLLPFLFFFLLIYYFLFRKFYSKFSKIMVREKDSHRCSSSCSCSAHVIYIYFENHNLIIIFIHTIVFSFIHVFYR
jgi:hypothetical protein